MPKKVQKIRKQKKKNKLGILFFILILLTIGFFIYRNSQDSSGRIASKDALQIDVYNPFEENKSENIPSSKNPVPTKKNTTSIPQVSDTNACNHDNGKTIPFNGGPATPTFTCDCSAFIIECREKKCVRFHSSDVEKCSDPFGPEYGWIADTWCSNPNMTGDGDGFYCVGKPIIYLYPQKPTFVDVKIETIGHIFISNPLYPESGWKKVLAYPNGNLWYQGGQYRELFYETDVEDFAKPVNGINIPKEKVEPELKRILTLLGLNEFERKEFMDFWVPILESQDKPYIQFSLIQGAAKDEIDKVIINPKPDTFIEILAYFKPLDIPFQGDALILPNEPPKRIGFTAVEWGGIIDDKYR